MLRSLFGASRLGGLASERGTTEQDANWDRLWSQQEVADGGLDDELRTLRFGTQRGLVERRLGSFEGLEVIEIGAGQARTR